MLSVCAVQVEVPPAATTPDAAVELGELQVLRALHRPLLGDPAHPDYAVASLAADHSRGDLHELRLLPGVRWQSGSPVDAGDVVAGLRSGVRRCGALARLLGLEPEQTVAGRDRVQLRAAAHPTVLARCLSQAAFAPRRRQRPTWCNGAYRPAVGGLYHPAAGRGPALRFEVVPGGREAVDRFAGVGLQLTAPAAFEVARLAPAGLRRCEPDLHAFVLLHPSRAGSLATLPARLALAEAVRAAGAPAEALVPDPFPELLRNAGTAAHARPDSALPAGLELIHSRFWPNRAMAAQVCRAASALGVGRAQPRAVSLATLAARVRRMDFDAALVLAPGAFGRELSLPMLLAAIATAAWGEPAVQRLAPLVRAIRIEHGRAIGAGALAAETVRHVPALPLYQFRSGYLAASGVPDLPLVGGCLYPLERLAEADRSAPSGASEGGIR